MRQPVVCKRPQSSASRAKRRSTSARGTLCPPCFTRTAMRRMQPQKNHFDAIASGLPLLQPAHIPQSAQRGFKGKIHPCFGEAIQFGQQESPARERSQFRSQRRKPGGDQIGVHKMNHPGVLRQKFPREGGFTRAVRPCYDDATRRFHACQFGFISGYSPSFLNRLFTSLKWKSREQSFSSSPFLKCLATSGSACNWVTKLASSRPACLTSQVFMAASWQSL